MELNKAEEENTALQKEPPPGDLKLKQKIAELELKLQSLEQEASQHQIIKEERDQLLTREQLLHQQLQSVLQNQNNDPSITLESISEAFFILDRQWHFTYLNSQAEKLLARTRQELIGHSIWEEFPQAVQSNFYTHYQRAFDTGKVAVFEEFYPPLNNWFEVHIYPSSQGLTVYFSIITQRIRVQQELEQQQLKLTTILDSTSEGLYGLDQTGCCTFINRAALAFFGYTEEECLGKDMHQLLHFKYSDGSPYPPEECRILKSLTAGKPARLVEEVLWHKDGSPLPTLYSCSLVVERGKTSGVVVTIIDLRERKQAQALLEETEARFQVIWESASDAVALSDEAGTVVAANPAYFTLYGYQSGQVIGHNFSIIFPEETRELAIEQYNQTFNGPKTVQAYEAVVKRSDGTERIVEASYDFITQNGVRTAMVSVVRDITERKQAQEALNKALLELKQVDELKDEFVALVVHDLRTPLTAVGGHAHLLNRNLIKINSDEVDEETKQLLLAKNSRSIEAIIHQSRRMEELISRLLEFSRIQAGKLELNFNREGNLLDLVSMVVEDQSVTTLDYTIALEVPEAEARIVTSFDAARLEQVLNNLISNAIKYSPKGTRITVGVEQRLAEAEVLVWVKDQGYGISPEAQAHLFERYYREHTTETKGIAGMGLGLYIGYEIIREHGGRMWVESQVGQGSTFYFTLPLKPKFVK